LFWRFPFGTETPIPAINLKKKENIAAMEASDKAHPLANEEERFLVPPSNEDGVDVIRAEPQDVAAVAPAACQTQRERSHEPVDYSDDDQRYPPAADGGIDVQRVAEEAAEQPAKQEVVLCTPVLARHTHVTSRPSAHVAAPAPLHHHQQQCQQQHGKGGATKSHAVPYEGNDTVHVKRSKKMTNHTTASEVLDAAAAATATHTAVQPSAGGDYIAPAGVAADASPKKTKHHRNTAARKGKHANPHQLQQCGEGENSAAAAEVASLKKSKKTTKKSVVKTEDEDNTASATAPVPKEVKAKLNPRTKRFATKPTKAPLVTDVAAAVAEGEAEAGAERTKAKTKKVVKKSENATKKAKKATDETEAEEVVPVAVMVTETATTTTTTVVVVAEVQAGVEVAVTEVVERKDEAAARLEGEHLSGSSNAVEKAVAGESAPTEPVEPVMEKAATEDRDEL
jgi:hypothetical protein